ncbi:hypothetical protein [Acinetobacter sp. HY1485]|uniref:hypothetical protein n=1 Tax=Acinetobacter sp. HY1485 TaxID=2970918 RepID=UPI0022B9D160|nr:hypothetical protein [Acinetobacter sp. HY1485]
MSNKELQVAFETYQASQYPNLTYEQLKNHLDDNEIFLEERYPESSRRAEDFEVYKAAWQEQQKKIDLAINVVKRSLVTVEHAEPTSNLLVDLKHILEAERVEFLEEWIEFEPNISDVEGCQ